MRYPGIPVQSVYVLFLLGTHAISWLPCAAAREIGWHAEGRAGVVAAGKAEAVEAGLSILEKGGNAADAAVATILALSITDYENPYEQALIRGRVVEIREDDDLQTLDAFSERYLGRPFPRRKWPSRVVYVVEAQVARYYRSPLEHTPAVDPKT